MFIILQTFLPARHHRLLKKRAISLIGYNNKNFAQIFTHFDESEDENDNEWIAPYKERNAFNHNLMKLRIEVCFVT